MAAAHKTVMIKKLTRRFSVHPKRALEGRLYAKTDYQRPGIDTTSSLSRLCHRSTARISGLDGGWRMSGNTPASNIVLVTIDSLRADAVGAYADSQYTPVLDSLAADGAVFENAFATGNWTPFSFPSILGARPVFADSGQIGVDQSPTLASVLSEADTTSDITTAGFNAANGFLTSHWGYDQGFDQFEPFVADTGSDLYSRYLATHPTVEAWIQLATSPVRRLRSWLGRKSTDRPFLDASRMFDVESAAKQFIDDTSSPFFLWVHYMDAHTPYVPAPRYIREVSEDRLGTHQMLHAHVRTGLGRTVDERTLDELRTLYKAAVRQIDASVGRLREALSTAGIADETAIVVAGDHGEEFQDHGHLAHYPKLYDELIRVPLIISTPDGQSQRIARPTGLDAIPPTVTDLLGVDPAPDWTRSSVLPAMSDGPLAPDPDSDADPADPVVSVAVRGEEVTQQPIPRSLDDGELLVSVRDKEWTYIEHAETGVAELYHRPTDPAQQDDRAVDPSPEAREVMNEFGAVARRHQQSLQDHTPEAPGKEVNADLSARLEALGYR